MTVTTVRDLLQRVREFAMPQGSPACRGFELRERGEIRMAPDKPWIAFQAEQRLDAQNLDFRWTARARMARVLPVTVVDAFQGGHGLLSVKIARVIPVASAAGREADRGEVLRALAELPWRPTGFAASGAWKGITWSSPAGQTLRCAYDDGAIRCYVDMEVDSEGRIISASAPDRPRAEGKTFVPTPWRGSFADYKTFDGLRVPTRAEVAWLLPEGAFTYFRCEVTSFRAAS